MRALVAGWFSFERMGASAGDLITRDIVCRWLQQVGWEFDVAVATPFTDGVDWRSVDPAAYSHAIFVCGPFGNGEPLIPFLARFAGSRLVGVNLSMLDSLDRWNPFDLLLERDSSRSARPDLAFRGEEGLVPVVGLVLIDAQPEYGARDLHLDANDALQRLVASREIGAVRIDTRLDAANLGALRTAAEIESLIAKMDVVATTRLHGMVLALKNGVPAIVVDPVAGGGKIRRQAAAIGWPVMLAAESATDQSLEEGLAFCLTPEARRLAGECRDRAQNALDPVRAEFISYFDEQRQPLARRPGVAAP